MKSYAIVDRIEENFAVCEVELIEVEKSHTLDFFNKGTKFMNIDLTQVPLNIGTINEQDVLIVEHDEVKVTEIYSKDEVEKQWRIDTLIKLIGQ